MKKMIFLAAAALLAGIAVFAQELEPAAPAAPAAPAEEQKERPFEFRLTFFNVGGALHFPLAIEGTAELVTLGIEDVKKGFGASFTPFYLFGWAGFRGKDISSGKLAGVADIGACVINPAVYWNFAGFVVPDNDELVLGPFIEFHWLFVNFLEGGIDAQRIRAKAGFQFGKTKGDKIKYNLYTVEMGYLLDGNHSPALQKGYTTIGPWDHKFFVGAKGGR